MFVRGFASFYDLSNGFWNCSVSVVFLDFHLTILQNMYGSVWFRFMVFNATFNYISFISWQSVLLVEETEVHGENH